MKKSLPLLCGVFLLVATSVSAETLFGPGTINIATNEAILINTIAGDDSGPNTFYLDGLAHFIRDVSSYRDARIAIAGPRTLTISNHFLVTFQRLQGSAIKTAIFDVGTTNVINVPNGKTIQLFYNGDFTTLKIFVRNQGSTEVYPIIYPKLGLHPAITGPATIEFSLEDNTHTFVSYYFTDEVLQLPPSGFLSTPAPALEVNIEKSYNLTNWTPTAVFNTEAEAGAFYRLRMLK